MLDDFGNRMKMYEKLETGRKFMPLLPVYARIDGRGFSKFTKGMERPYDPIMTSLMRDTTKDLVNKTQAIVGYTQSDEISLLFYTDKPDSSIFFEGKIQKMCSVLSGLASSLFMFHLMESDFGPEYLNKLPHFDCRVFSLPNKIEAANAFLWREQDATKNAISMAAQHYYSHKKLQGVNSTGKRELLWDRGINFEDYPVAFKRGTFYRRVNEEREIEQEIWDKIPEHKRPDNRIFMRSSVQPIDMPPFNTVSNRVEVLFDGAEPTTYLKDAVQAARKIRNG